MFCLAICLVQIACTHSESDKPILVFAAASLVDSMSEIETAYEERYNVEVSVSFGGSQMLMQQIIRGAPADVFIPAGDYQISELETRNLILGEPTNILLNRLVVISRSEMVLDSLDNLSHDSIQKIAIANPQLAPAGKYAQEALIKTELWETIQDKIILGIDVRATLGYIESGNVDASIVYKTDAATVDTPISIYEVPQHTYSGINYPAAVISRPERHEFSEEFVNFLSTVYAGNIFESYGFEPTANKR